MKKYTQRELLSEGIWNNIKNSRLGRGVAKVGRGIAAAARGADYIIGKVAPEVQPLYKGLGSGVKGFKNAVGGSYDPNKKGGVSEKTQSNIKYNLKAKGHRVSFKPISFVTRDNATKKDIYQAYIINPTNGRETSVYSDKDGNIINP